MALIVGTREACGDPDALARAEQWMREHAEWGPFAPLTCDDEGRVFADSPSAGAILLADPVGEVAEAGGTVARGATGWVGEALGGGARGFGRGLLPELPALGTLLLLGAAGLLAFAVLSRAVR